MSLDSTLTEDKSIADNLKHQTISFWYAFFLVFITPISLPLAIWTLYEGWVSTSVLVLTFLMYVASGLGVTVGYHRLITHRSFETKPWLKRLLLIFGCFSLQGSPASWASLHIQHHRFSDKPGDPHTPVIKGFWHGHCGWTFQDYKPNLRRYGKWLLKDKEVRFVSKYYVLFTVLSLAIPLVLCGWIGLLWAGFLRVFLFIHMTWAVNSVCHLWGKRDYPNVPDTSTNNMIVALLTFGEGWHNNHHRYMQAPFFGFRWYQIDFGKWFIMLCSKLGLAWDLKIPREFKTPSTTSTTL